MQCPNCGFPIDEANKFCTNCGADISNRGDRKVSSGGQGDGGDHAEPRTNRRRYFMIGIVAAIVAVILVAVATAMVPRLLGGTGNADVAEDRNVVYYGSAEAAKVHPSATVVLYGDDGKLLDEYDVTVMDQSGEVTTTHISDGEFAPNEVGAESEGTYSVIARDSNGAILDVPDFDVVSQQKDSNGGDGNDDEVHDELAVKPESDDNDSNSSGAPNKEVDQVSDARRTAYALFYDKFQELQNQYGEGATANATRADDGVPVYFLNGVGIVKLVDFNADGVEELLVAYRDDDKAEDVWNSYIVTVWQYDDSSSSLSSFSYEPFINPSLGFACVSIRGYDSDHPMLFNSSMEQQDDGIVRQTTYLLYSDDDGDLTLTTLQHDGIEADGTLREDDGYLIDGDSVDMSAYQTTQEQLGLDDDVPFSHDILSSVPTDFPMTDGSVMYNTSDVLSNTEDTIETIKQGMMNGFDDDSTSSSSSRSPSAADTVSGSNAVTDRLDECYVDMYANGFDDASVTAFAEEYLDMLPPGFVQSSGSLTGDTYDSLVNDIKNGLQAMIDSYSGILDDIDITTTVGLGEHLDASDLADIENDIADYDLDFDVTDGYELEATTTIVALNDVGNMSAGDTETTTAELSMHAIRINGSWYLWSNLF